MKKSFLFLSFIFMVPLYILAQGVTVYESGGWLETAYVKWMHVKNATSYNVYCSGEGVVNQKIDEPLIRNYGNCNYRADVLGLKAGIYTVTVVPVFNGVENMSLATTTSPITVKPHVREGYAFLVPITLGTKSTAFVPGAYNMDGTPKTGAKIIYVTAKNANTVTCNVKGEKGTEVLTTGFMNIINARNKGFDKSPFIIRMIGLIKATDITGLKDNIYINFKGANKTDRKAENITIEGVGHDATLSGYGIYNCQTTSIEIRNLGIMLFGDDAVSLEGDNNNVWVHNCDFYYGKPGSDADQVKGDGTIDMKYRSTNVTISYNHFFDTGKTTFAGGADEVANTIFYTYHHNWFDHSDSRNVRVCWGIVHMYNNYMDANATMDLLNTEAASVFVEANTFRNCPYPMMINMQGTNYEKWPNGTQKGGMTKAYNNSIDKVTKLLYQSDRPTDFDAYLVSTRDEKIPTTVQTRFGANTYNNFDTDSSMYSYNPHAPADVVANVTTYAGRCNGGDLKWTFNNAVDDNLTTVNVPLKTAITNYASSIAFVQGEGTPTNCALDDNKAVTASNVEIYPNPVETSMKVIANDPISNINIYTLSGILVRSVKDVTTSVDLNHLPNGLYRVALNLPNGTIQKIIIKK